MLKMRYTVCLTILLLSSSVQAEVVHELFYRLPGLDAIESSIVVDPGSTIDASIVFRETVSGDGIAIMGGAGLGGVGFRLIAEGSDGRFAIVQRPTFQIPSVINNADTIAGASPFGGVTQVNNLGNGVYEATLGSVQLTAPTLGETVFSFIDPQPTADNFAGIGPGTTINESAIRYGSLSVTAVPEPGSLIALTLLSAAGFVYRRRIRSTKS